MRELIRIEDGTLESRLQRYNLAVYEGDVMYVQSISGGSLSALRDVLCGERTLESGRLFVGERAMERYDVQSAADAGVYVVTFGREFIETMTIAENLLPKGSIARFYSRRRTVDAIRRYFQEEGLDLDPEMPVWKLTDGERKKLGILKAKLVGARLIILDLVSTQMGGRIEAEIRAMVERLQKEGFTFLVLSTQFLSLVQTATRLQIMVDGTDRKEWEGIDDALRRELETGSLFLHAGRGGAAEGLSAASAVGTAPQGEKSVTGPKRRNDASGGVAGAADSAILGLYDYEWEFSDGLWSYLAFVREHNPLVWERYIGAELPAPGEAAAGGTVLIPVDSADLLITSLTVEQNLTIAAGRRIADWNWGRISKRLEQNLVEEYFRQLKLSRSVRHVSELSRFQRKLLSIARWRIVRPKILILENPYYGMNVEETYELTNYLRQTAAAGTRVVVVSQALDLLMVHCGGVLRTKNGRGAEVLGQGWSAAPRRET